MNKSLGSLGSIRGTKISTKKKINFFRKRKIKAFHENDLLAYRYYSRQLKLLGEKK